MEKEEKYSNDSIAFLADISSNFKRSRMIVMAMAFVSVIAITGAMLFTYTYTQKEKEQIYVIDGGSVLYANRADGMPQRNLEIRDHVTRFHQLFYNLAPNIDMINANIKTALEYGDESVYDFFGDLKEKQYYSRLVGINAVQQIQVDSIKIDMEAYPYKVHTYSSIFLLRESNISRYDYQTTCDVVDIPRSQTNPHGLLIRNYLQVKNEFLGTKKVKN